MPDTGETFLVVPGHISHQARSATLKLKKKKKDINNKLLAAESLALELRSHNSFLYEEGKLFPYI